MKSSGSKAKVGSTSQPKSPDTEELFLASEEESGGDDYDSESSKTQTDTDSSSGPSGEAPVFEHAPCYSERSSPPTPKGATDSEVERIIQKEKLDAEVDQLDPFTSERVGKQA